MEAEGVTGNDLTGSTWRKSSHSGGNGGNCVEVTTLPGAVAVRDSKNPTGPALVLTPAEWKTFLAGIKEA